MRVGLAGGVIAVLIIIAVILGYGTLFTVGNSGCPTGWVWFHNNHWGGYLAPFDPNTNGSPMILNGSKTCYLNFPAQ